jgi:CspA family cold shock protein
MGYDIINLINTGADSRKRSTLNLQPPFLILIASLYINMQQGTIARLTDKGFGFIKRDGQEKDLFFHSNEVVGTTFDQLREGDTVSFEVAESPKGPNAVKVSRV